MLPSQEDATWHYWVGLNIAGCFMTLAGIGAVPLSHSDLKAQGCAPATKSVMVTQFQLVSEMSKTDVTGMKKALYVQSCETPPTEGLAMLHGTWHVWWMISQCTTLGASHAVLY